MIPNLKKYRKLKGLTLGDVSELLGVSDAQISRLERGNSDVSYKQLIRFAEIYEVEPENFISEESRIPLYGTVSAGGFKMVVTDIQPEDLPTLPAPPGLPKNSKNIALKVDGDSMDKIAPEGSTVFVNTQDKELINGKCYVFRDYRNPEMAQFKRWQAGDPDFSQPDLLMPFSTNSDHLPIPITPGTELEVIGRAVMVVSEV